MLNSQSGLPRSKTLEQNAIQLRSFPRVAQQCKYHLPLMVVGKIKKMLIAGPASSKTAPASDSGAPNSCSFGNTLKKTALEEKGKRSSRERERTGLPVFPGLHPSALFQLPDGLTETPLVLCVDEGRLGRDDALHKQAFDVVVHRLHPNIAIGL